MSGDEREAFAASLLFLIFATGVFVAFLGLFK
jgi:hypothetical protein